MAQFDVYTNSNSTTNRDIPFLLDIQANLLDSLVTRIVVPLWSVSQFGQPAQHLNPQFTITDTNVVMSTAELAGVPLAILGERIANLEHHRNEIISALDFLFTGV